MTDISEHMRPETIQALDGIVKFLKQDYQRLWLYTGENRVGKSTLAQHFSYYVTDLLNSRLFLCFFYWSYPGEEDAIDDIRQDFGLEKTNIYPASVEYAQVQGKTYDNIDVDEAVRMVHKANWNTAEAIDFTINFDIYGKRRYLYHLLMPEWEFTKGFREGRVHMHIDVPKRGYVYFYKPVRKNKVKVFPDQPTWTDKFPALNPERDEIYNQVKDHMLSLAKSFSKRINLKDKMMDIAVRAI